VPVQGMGVAMECFLFHICFTIIFLNSKDIVTKLKLFVNIMILKVVITLFCVIILLMNLVSTEIPTSYAVELLSLGLDMQAAGVSQVPCRIPCIEASEGLLIPTMEGEKRKYPMHPFAIAINGSEQTGGGLVTLSPIPTEHNANPRVGLPIYRPDEAERSAPYAFRMIVSSQVGYTALRNSFGIETVTGAQTGRDRYVGTTAMVGMLADGGGHLLHPEPTAASFYMGLLKNVGAAKFAKLLAERREASERAEHTASLALAV